MLLSFLCFENDIWALDGVEKDRGRHAYAHVWIRRYGERLRYPRIR